MAEKLIGNWKRKSRKTEYDNNWIRVDHDEVVNPNGGKGIYGVVHYKNLAIGIIRLDDENNTWIAPKDYQEGTTRQHPAHTGRTDRLEHGRGIGRKRRAEKIQGQDAGRKPSIHQAGRRTRQVQEDHPGHRSGRAQERFCPQLE